MRNIVRLWTPILRFRGQRLLHRFCTIKKPEEDLDDIQMEFIEKILKGDYEGGKMTPIENEGEHNLSLKLVLMENPEQILDNLRRQPPTNTNELFLYVYTYSTLGNPSLGQMKQYLDKVIREMSQLSSRHLLKFYQLIYSLRFDIQVPPFPDINGVPKENMIEIIYFLAKLYPNSPELAGLLARVPEEEVMKQPLVYTELLLTLPPEAGYISKQKIDSILEQLEESEDIAKIILLCLKNGYSAVLSHLPKVEVEQLELDALVELALEVSMTGSQTNFILKEILDRKQTEYSKQSYLNLWLLCTKSSSSQTDAIKQILSHTPIPSDLQPDDKFTVVMCGMVSNHQDFLSQHQSFICQELSSLNSNQIYSLYKGSRKHKLNRVLEAIRRNVLGRNDFTKARAEEILYN